MAIKGEFEPFKAAIAAENKVFAERIVAFRPNEHVEGLEEFKPVSVLELLQLLMAMDLAHSDANNHPVEAYKNKAFAARFYAERNSEYTKMFPLVGDFFALYDKLRETVPQAYDAANTRPRRCSPVKANPLTLAKSSRSITSIRLGARKSCERLTRCSSQCSQHSARICAMSTAGTSGMVRARWIGVKRSLKGRASTWRSRWLRRSKKRIS
jgi:hypothetical protein